MQIPIELIEQVAKGNCVLFAGAGVSVGTHGQRGLPSGGELAQELAERCGYTEPGLALPEITQYYELVSGRNNLVAFIRDRLDDTGLTPLPAHQLIARLPFDVIITTNYDRLLERALEGASKPYVRVVGNEEISYLDRGKVTLIKIHGSIEQPGSLIVTTDDYLEFFENLPSVSSVVKAQFATKTLLFVGYSLGDRNFQRLYTEVTREIDRHKRRAYAVQLQPSDFAIKWWESKQVQIIPADATEFLRELAAELNKLEALPRPTAVPSPPVEKTLIRKRPYKALNYFDPEDEDIFFGRREETEKLLSLIFPYRLVVLYGESGAGKTSLINAGVIPKLTRAGYTVIGVRALEDPIEAIRRKINRQLPEPIQSASSLQDFLRHATDTMNRYRTDPTSPIQGVVVFLDQFEEFFIRLSPELRSEIINELGQVYDERDIPVKFVFSLRDDYFAKLSELEWRIPEVFRNKLWLRRLTRHQAAEAITQPVHSLGINYEPALVEQLLDDLFSQGVYPPHLQIVCAQLYDALEEGETQIASAHYDRLGGTQHILATYTSTVLAEFPPHLVTIAKATLGQLVTSLGTKAVLEESRLATRVGGRPEDRAVVWEKLVNSRLIRRAEQEGAVYYELAHEYLVMDISTWIDEEGHEVKKARELLAQEVDNWRRYKMLIPPDRMEILNRYREQLEHDADAQELLARSALAENVEPLAWLRLVTDREAKERVFSEVAVHHDRSDIRMYAVSELATISTTDGICKTLLKAALEDSEAIIRWTAAEALSDTASDEITEFLLARAFDPEDLYRTQAREAFVVLWESGRAVPTASFWDRVRLVYTALGMSWTGHLGSLRQFGFLGILGGLVGGSIGGIIDSVANGRFMQPLLSVLNRFFDWLDAEQVKQSIQATTTQVLWMAKQISLLLRSIYVSIDPTVRSWLPLLLLSWALLWIGLKLFPRRHSVVQTLRLLRASAPRLVPSLIGSLTSIMRDVTASSWFAISLVVLVPILLFDTRIVGDVLIGIAIGLFVGTGAGVVDMWGRDVPLLRERIAGPALGCLAVTVTFIVLSVGLAILATGLRSLLTGFWILVLIDGFAKGLTIGLGVELTLSDARLHIPTWWGWRVLCRLARRTDLASKASQNAPTLSLVGPVIALLGSVLTTLLLRRPTNGIFLFGPLVATLVLVLAMAHTVPSDVRKEIAKLSWLQEDRAKTPELWL